MNFKKSMNALLPNTCHYLDSLLMYSMLEELIKLNIPIKTLHDSFYTNIKYKDLILDTYINQYIQLFENNLLYIILKNVFIKFMLNKDFNNLLKKCDITADNILELDLKIFNSKKIKTLDLNNIQLLSYKCIVKIIKNYLIIKKENELDINFRSFVLKNRNKNAIL
jgi:DNA-directed RNA polymerase